MRSDRAQVALQEETSTDFLLRAVRTPNDPLSQIALEMFVRDYELNNGAEYMRAGTSSKLRELKHGLLDAVRRFRSEQRALPQR